MERITSYRDTAGRLFSPRTTIPPRNLSVCVFSCFILFCSLLLSLSLSVRVSAAFWLPSQTSARSLFELIMLLRNSEGENVLFSSLLRLLSARSGFVLLFTRTMRNSTEVRLFFLPRMVAGVLVWNENSFYPVYLALVPAYRRRILLIDSLFLMRLVC